MLRLPDRDQEADPVEVCDQTEQYYSRRLAKRGLLCPSGQTRSKGTGEGWFVIRRADPGHVRPRARGRLPGQSHWSKSRPLQTRRRYSLL